MNNNLQALNNYLFEELERLNDDDEINTDEKLEREIKRSKAITDVASQIVQNAKVVLDAKKHSDSFGDKLTDFYKLEYKDNKKEEFKKSFIEFRENHKDL